MIFLMSKKIELVTRFSKLAYFVTWITIFTVFGPLVHFLDIMP